MKSIWKYLIILSVFILTVQMPIDLDLGWHLRYGQYFFQTGHVLRDNIISYVWPAYTWVQASWGYDLLVYELFTRFGFWGLSVTCALVSTAIFLLVVSPVRKKSPQFLVFLALVFLTQTVPLYAAGMRSQTPSSLFFALFLLLVSPAVFSASPWIFALPVLTVLWANMHGGFALGVILAWIIWACYGVVLVFRKKAGLGWKRFFVVGAVVAVATVTPVINPWGFRIYEETFKHSTNINLTLIGEWTPLTSDRIETALFGLVALLVLFTAFKRRRVSDLPYLAAFFVSAYLAVSALRFVINFGLISVLYLSRNFRLSDWIPENRLRFTRNAATAVFLTAFVFDLIVFQRFFYLTVPKLFRFTWETYCEAQNICSEPITQIMRNDPPKGHGFHPYNYGGYLSWRVPAVQTFIDGRMAAWADAQGNTPPVFDGDRVFEDSTPIMFRKLDSIYNFTWIIIPSNSPLNEYLLNSSLWNQKYRDKLFSYYVKKSL